MSAPEDSADDDGGRDTSGARDGGDRRDTKPSDAGDRRNAGASDAGDGKPGAQRRSRSAKARHDELEQRKADTGTRRGDPRAGFGKDPPPKGGRNKGGRGKGR